MTVALSLAARMIVNKIVKRIANKMVKAVDSTRRPRSHGRGAVRGLLGLV